MGPLNGVRILDFSRVLAGPWCTQTLADLGADVWKIEAPGLGDDTRSWMPPEINGESTYFLCANRSKRSIVVDMKTDEGRWILKEFANQADIVVENFRPDVLPRFGLDYRSLSAANPRLIYCSISGFGRSGPRAAEPGYDFSIQAESGLMSITGEPAGEPMKMGIAITDIVTGMYAAQAVLSALFSREQTGKGQAVDLSLFESAVSLLANVASGYLATGAEPERYGNAHATVAPYELYPSADGAFVLAVGNDKQFRALCADVLKDPALAADNRFATNKARAHNRTQLTALLSHAFSKFPTGHWLDALKEAGVPVGKVRSVKEVFEAPEIIARGMVSEVTHSTHGPLKILRSPIRLSETPVRIPGPPPRLGEHTNELLHEILGSSPEQIEAWRLSGAVQ